MSFQADYLKETGLLSAYQAFIKQLINNPPNKESALEEAAYFFSIYEKTHKPNTKIQAVLAFPEKNSEQKLRKKIVLETKARSYPSAPIITSKAFDINKYSRPQFETYKQDKIEYVFLDIFNEQPIELHGDIDMNQLTRKEKPENKTEERVDS